MVIKLRFLLGQPGNNLVYSKLWIASSVRAWDSTERAGREPNARWRRNRGGLRPNENHPKLMQKLTVPLLFLSFFTGPVGLRAQTAPDPEAWPTTSQTNARVHFVSVDAAFTGLSANWTPDLQILNGGDQTTASVTIGGHTGLKATSTYLNIADSAFTEWADDDVIDILMQVYGDAALLAGNGTPRTFTFLTGTLPELSAPVGGSLPVEAKNKKWNWVLFRIPNGIRPSDGTHYVGSIPANAQGGFQNGGVNGGTIRAQNVPNLIVRLVAFGPQGAFGETNQINLFAAGETCAPEPETNLVFNDINANTNQHLTVLNAGDQTVTFQNNVGPTNDLRRAVRANGSFMNFGITDSFLGLPCNDPRAVKICVEFFDDAALAGTVFGPEAYATDDKGGIGTYPIDRRHTLEGTGKWVRRSFTVAAVNLKGVNTAPLTGGPRLIFEGGQVFISSVALGIFRTGTNALADLDPLPDCYEDPKICTDAYGNYAELDLAKGIQNGLAPGTSGGDQLMVQEEAGPANDRRLAVRPDGTPGIYLNFAITDLALGPSTQPNAQLAMCVTYYDDPALAGATLRPQVYQSDRGGQLGLAFAPASLAVALEGTGQWRDAYFEIPDMKFYGVNQGPQAAARFAATGLIYVSRLRYAVIRPCGPKAGVNLLESCKPGAAPRLAAGRNANTVRLAWPTNTFGFSLQTTTNLGAPQWTAVTNAPMTEADQNVVTQSISGSRFYRLAK
jgi:hypothetical protein